MAKDFASIEDSHREFIARQKIFFTASAAGGSHVNLSPRSTDALRILGPNQVCYLDLTGSGNETTAHLRAGGRATIMLCAFEGPPMILRLYGRGGAVSRGNARYEQLIRDEFSASEPLGARQIVMLDIDLVKTSCGYAVPLFGYQKERESLVNWAESKGPEGLEQYRREKNVLSMDGLPTGIFDAE
ncbi:MAG TPA: pyridoxamine 5'-phosphate oxidase family protein [Rhizomicrobium sp.]|nr:pyridoxamine 5'-phosphate oxidase family protein [Rhizomicrobium sp.]